MIRPQPEHLQVGLLDRDDMVAAEAVAMFTLEALWHQPLPFDSERLSRAVGACTSPTRTTFVAHDSEGKILAVAGLLPGDAKVGSLVDIAVSPLHRKQGLGRFIVGYAEQAATQMGLVRLRATSSSANVGFYKKLGYEKDEHTPRYAKNLLPIPASAAFDPNPFDDASIQQ